MERPVKAVKGGTLIDGTGATPLKDSVVVIEGSKIIEVGRLNEVEIPAGADIINANGRVVMPGIIDCHTHISAVPNTSPGTGWGSLESSLTDRAVMAVVAARKLIEAGVTTIRDVGANAHIDIAVRDAVKRGDVIGPRIFASDAGICITGGHVDHWKSVRTLAFEGMKETGRNGIADGVTECIKAVREQVRVGADLIKIFATGGVMEATVRAGMWELSEEEIAAACKEAKKSQRFVAVHAVSPPEAITFCSEMGVRSIDHGIWQNEESIQMMREKGTYLVPTMIAYQGLTNEAYPPTLKETARKAVVTHEKTLRMAKKAGVKIAMGTDSAAVYERAYVNPIMMHGKCQWEELELMATRGLSEMESIVAATKTAAECIGIGNETGTIEPGKFADILVVDANPLKDMMVFRDLSRIKLVMKEGTVYVTRP